MKLSFDVNFGNPAQVGAISKWLTSWEGAHLYVKRQSHEAQ